MRYHHPCRSASTRDVRGAEDERRWDGRTNSHRLERLMTHAPSRFLLPCALGAQGCMHIMPYLLSTQCAPHTRRPVDHHMVSHTAFPQRPASRPARSSYRWPSLIGSSNSGSRLTAGRGSGPATWAASTIPLHQAACRDNTDDWASCRRYLSEEQPTYMVIMSCGFVPNPPAFPLVFDFHSEIKYSPSVFPSFFFGPPPLLYPFSLCVYLLCIVGLGQAPHPETALGVRSLPVVLRQPLSRLLL